MTEPIESIDLEGGFRLEVHYDDDPIDPRDPDTVPGYKLGHVVSFVKGHTIGDESCGDKRSPLEWLLEELINDYGQDHVACWFRNPGESWTELADLLDDSVAMIDRIDARMDDALLLDKFRERHVILELDYQDYGAGVTLKAMPLRSFYDPPRHYQWDGKTYNEARRVDGFIVVGEREALQHFGPLNEHRAQIEAQLIGEVETYAHILNGEVYGYILYGPPQTDEDGEEIEGTRRELDTCWGFIGDLDDCIQSGKAAAAHYQALPRDALPSLSADPG